MRRSQNYPILKHLDKTCPYRKEVCPGQVVPTRPISPGYLQNWFYMVLTVNEIKFMFDPWMTMNRVFFKWLKFL